MNDAPVWRIRAVPPAEIDLARAATPSPEVSQHLADHRITDQAQHPPRRVRAASAAANLGQAQGSLLPDDAWPLPSIPGGGGSGDSSTNG